MGNVRSIRLVESVGMRREGTIRSAHLKRGAWIDAHIYGLLRDEWLNGGQPSSTLSPETSRANSPLTSS